MGDVLHVDYAVLDGSRQSLETIGRVLQDAPRQKDALRAAVGHHGLADAISDFADNWDRHRGALVEQMGTLAKTLADASATFHQADLDAGAALTTTAPAAPTYGPPAPTTPPVFGPPAPTTPPVFGPPAPGAAPSTTPAGRP